MPARTDPKVEVEVIERYLAGDYVCDICADLGINKATVTRVRERHGVPRRRRIHHAERHPNWRGGRRITKQGYVKIRMDPEDALAVATAASNREVLEHRLVMAHYLGRALRRNETVHHINGDKQDNRIENLQLRSGQHGRGQVRFCAECGSNNIEERRA